MLLFGGAAQTTAVFWSVVPPPTYHWLQDVLHAFDQLLVDLDGQVTDHLSVLCQVKVGQAVLILPGCIVLHKDLGQKQSKKPWNICLKIEQMQQLFHIRAVRAKLQQICKHEKSLLINICNFGSSMQTRR